MSLIASINPTRQNLPGEGSEGMFSGSGIQQIFVLTPTSPRRSIRAILALQDYLGRSVVPAACPAVPPKHVRDIMVFVFRDHCDLAPSLTFSEGKESS